MLPYFQNALRTMQADMYQAKHGGSAFVAWVKQIHPNEQKVKSKAGMFIESLETAEPAVKSTTALFHYATPGDIEQLAMCKIYGAGGTELAARGSFKSQHSKYHKAQVHECAKHLKAALASSSENQVGTYQCTYVAL
eukprot:scaffold45999_cov37-Prasinocladus_malaysianus.AAC.1